MAKPEWGKKRKCLNCSSKFYDLMKDPIVCPKCKTIFNNENVVLKIKKTSKTSEKSIENSIIMDKTIDPISDEAINDDFEEKIEVSETEGLLDIDEETTDLVIEKDLDIENNMDLDINLDNDKHTKQGDDEINEDDTQ